MEPIKLANTGYRSQKITMSFLKANTVALVYPLPIVIVYLEIVLFFAFLRKAGAAGAGQAVTQTAGALEAGTTASFGMTDLLLYFLL